MTLNLKKSILKIHLQISLRNRRVQSPCFALCRPITHNAYTEYSTPKFENKRKTEVIVISYSSKLQRPM